MGIVEACHKRLKNNVLPQNYFENISYLAKDLPRYHEQYNNIAQYHLKGLTPNQAEAGFAFDKEHYKILSLEATQKRMVNNKRGKCCKAMLETAT
jgi:hypothetical protein